MKGRLWCGAHAAPPPPHPHPHSARPSTRQAGLGAAPLRSVCEMCKKQKKVCTSMALSHLAPRSCHPPFTSRSTHIQATPRKLWSHCCCGRSVPPTCSLRPPRLRLTAALSVCRGVLENTNRSLMKCLQKVTGWRRRRGREPTTEEVGGKGGGEGTGDGVE